MANYQTQLIEEGRIILDNARFETNESHYDKIQDLVKERKFLEAEQLYFKQQQELRTEVIQL